MIVVVISQMVADIYINVVRCPLSMPTQGCVKLALQNYFNVNFINI